MKPCNGPGEGSRQAEEDRRPDAGTTVLPLLLTNLADELSARPKLAAWSPWTPNPRPIPGHWRARESPGVLYRLRNSSGHAHVAGRRPTRQDLVGLGITRKMARGGDILSPIRWGSGLAERGRDVPVSPTLPFIRGSGFRASPVAASVLEEVPSWLRKCGAAPGPIPPPTSPEPP